MLNKKHLIGTFVKKHKILSFIEKLKNTSKIKSKDIFLFTIEGNENEYLLTFKTGTINRLINSFYKSTTLHVKNGCLFSINALNKLIEKENNTTINNHKDYVIDWEKYRDNLIIMTSGKLCIYKLNRITDKNIILDI